MYEYLEGRPSLRAAARLVLEVGGVGYDLIVPLGARFGEGKQVRAYVHLLVRDDAHILFGFPDVKLRDLFRTLLKVRGVGPAMALAILSALPGEDLIAAIQNEDTSRLCTVKGVGKRTADQILLDLHGKIDAFGPAGLADGKGKSPAPSGGNLADAATALVSIGYKEKDAERAVAKAAEKVGTEDLDGLIRAALTLK